MFGLNQKKKNHMSSEVPEDVTRRNTVLWDMGDIWGGGNQQPLKIKAVVSNQTHVNSH